MKFTAGYAAFDGTDIIPEEDSKEVFAYFGLAIHVSNVLEHGVANAVFVARLLPNVRGYASNEDWGRAIDGHFDHMFSLTYGNMIRELEKAEAYSSSLVERLWQTKRTRDRLVHHFQREAADLMLSRVGRQKMIADYQVIIDEISLADSLLEEEIGPIRRAQGATDEWLDEAFESGLRRILDGEGDSK